MATGKILYARQQQHCILKFIGDIRYNQSPALNSFLVQLGCQPTDEVIVDLTEATGIDSTMLGLLAKLANRARRNHQHQVPIFSTNDDINQVLEGVGFNRVFAICDNPACCSKADYHQELPITNTSRQELAQILLDAHQVLSEMNDNNREAFRDVVELFGQQLKSNSS